VRVKTFIATYLLFLTVLFLSVGIVSFYLNDSQITMLKNKSEGQFHSIVSMLDRDVLALSAREGLTDEIFFASLESMIWNYNHYYERHGVFIVLNFFHAPGLPAEPAEIHIGEGRRSGRDEDGLFVFIRGSLSPPFSHFILSYRLDITDNISDMRGIQRTLLITAASFSLVAAAGLYGILLMIFKPLGLVAKTAREIADGQFNQRIPIKSNNELAQVAIDFNKMARRVETQILYLEEEAENKQQFVDNFAHEMRTPLTSIFGYAEYMQKASLEESEVVETAGRIMDKANYLTEIANSLLQLAMLRDYRPEKTELDIKLLFDDITQTISEPMGLAKVRFSAKPNAATLHGQGDLIKSLLVNLCINAMKSCTAETGKVNLEAKADGNAVLLTITDNGCGIPPGALAKITEPFYRVDAARNRKDGGAGLGLAICKKITEAHGANMRIESAPGVGTVVTITFTTP